MIGKILNNIQNPLGEDSGLIEYDEGMVNLYNYVITAHANEDQEQIVVSFFKPDQWEMVLSTSQLLGVDTEEIVRGLEPDDVHQIILSSTDLDL